MSTTKLIRYTNNGSVYHIPYTNINVNVALMWHAAGSRAPHAPSARLLAELPSMWGDGERVMDHVVCGSQRLARRGTWKLGLAYSLYLSTNGAPGLHHEVRRVAPRSELAAFDADLAQLSAAEETIAKPEKDSTVIRADVPSWRPKAKTVTEGHVCDMYCDPDNNEHRRERAERIDDMKPEQPPSTAIVVAGWHLEQFPDDPEPRILDVVLGEKLGYSEPKDVVRVIEQLIEDGELPQVFSCRKTAEWIAGKGGKRTKVVKAYYLTEEEALIVITKARTPRAHRITREVIQVYLAVRHGEIPQPSKKPMIVQQAELMLELAKEQARITERVDKVEATVTRIEDKFTYIGREQVLALESIRDKAIESTFKMIPACEADRVGLYPACVRAHCADILDRRAFRAAGIIKCTLPMLNNEQSVKLEKAYQSVSAQESVAEFVANRTRLGKTPKRFR